MVAGDACLRIGCAPGTVMRSRLWQTGGQAGGAWKESELEPRRVSRCTCSSQSQRAVSLAVTSAMTIAATIAVTSVMYLAPG